jgi:hypothetical protein
VELTICVGCWAPFHSTTQVEEKLDPITVRLKPGLPAAALAGERLPLSCGAEGAGVFGWLLEAVELFETVQPARHKRSGK